VYCVLWLAELKSSIRVRHKFTQVHPNQAEPIYRAMVRWDKCANAAQINFRCFVRDIVYR